MSAPGFARLAAAAALLITAGGGAIALLAGDGSFSHLGTSRGPTPSLTDDPGSRRAPRTVSSPTATGQRSRTAAARLDGRTAASAERLARDAATLAAEPRSAAPVATRLSTAARLRAAAAAAAARRAAAAVLGPVTPEEAEALRRKLASKSPEARAAALREIRDRHATALEPDAAKLLGADEAPTTRRLAAQVLALGDAASHQDALSGLKKDKDALVRLNAAFGLARAGDEKAQAWLLQVSQASRSLAPNLGPFVEDMLASPELRSAPVIERYRQASGDARLDPARRARAAQILTAKLAG